MHFFVEASPRGGDKTVGVSTGETKSAALGGGSKEEIARHHIASELLQTEKNFVNILNTIVTVSGGGSGRGMIHCTV